MEKQYKFSCGILPTVKGHTLKALTPDENGAYTICVGAIGVPTRNDVVYDTDSLIAAMNDPTSRFNICLRDGCLAGEYGHPDIKSREDLPRLMQIKESMISHYFHRIWIDDTSPIHNDGMTGYRIMAKVKPYGPYGAALERSLQDPCHNTSFSIRSVILPMQGPDPKYEYRKVQLVVTFDAVHAPGFEFSNKRYAGNESFQEVAFDRGDLESSLASCQGMEAATMLTEADVMKLFGDHDITLDGRVVSTGITGAHSLLRKDGSVVDAATMLYKKRK